MELKVHHFDHDLHLYDLGDVHIGNKTCDHDLLDKVIDKIDGDPQAAWFTTGDVLECAIEGSKSDTYSAMSVDEEYSSALEKLGRIKRKGLWMIPGNHEARITKRVGIDVGKNLARELGIDYYESTARVNVTCGRASYFIASTHGKGSGRGRGAATESLNRFGKLYPGFDIYVQGHTHKHIAFHNTAPVLNRKLNLFFYKKQTLVCTGHFMQYEGSYAQTMDLEPMPEGAAVINLRACGSGNEQYKKVTVDLAD